ncbi:MAG TPA: multicopper oxidase domain-containing protein [Nocardioides sp.]|uniref:multicopper oxidase domain-containing protein n=1 Tax=Nocardioides sp. TaxID=35761 RepID=UPI002BDFFE42|nr:multicopper oxidase domain-containing protein [Nocardioides sp.]HQR26916.1 multicopper oxidase domain-containing protein [Nocardioides sp.]
MTHGLTLRRATAALTATGLALLGTVLLPTAPASAATVSVDLYAVAGSTTLPGGQTVDVLGYATASGGTVNAPGGPVLEADEGDTVEVTLHNELAVTTALVFQGQPLQPDLTGVAAGGTKTYSFTASHAGTYLYEAGLAPNTQYQTAMGLHGALVVHPAAAGQAYDAAGTAYDTDAVLVLSEIDPALNAAKASFDLRKFNPQYTLVNGKAYPDTTAIAATGGQRVLLRYVNAGVQYHSMGVLGAGQTVVALDGSPLDQARHYTAETIGPGQTADAIVVAPDQAETDRSLVVYDASGLLHNSNTGGLGGMVTEIPVAGSGPAANDTAGPVAGAVAYNGTDLTATVDDSQRGGGTVAEAEYYVDDLTTPAGSMAAADGAFDTATEDVTAPVSLGSGQHVLYVRGRDSGGTWGTFSSVLVTGADSGGPSTLAPVLTPRVTNGSGAVAVSATGDDSASGNSAIQAAELFIDTQGPDGSGTTMVVNQSAPIASLDATIPAGTVAALAEGSHVIWIHAQDAQGNWGAAITANLVVDTTGPDTSGALVEPTPNNGTIPFNSTIAAVRVSVPTMTDPVSGSVNSTITKAELFIDTVGGNGTGVPLIASDGLFNDASEGGYTDIPLATVRALANGPHTLYVHAKDEAGNWGASATATLLVDKTAPTLSAVTVSPSPTQGAATLTLSATVTDAWTGPVAAEWFVGTDPGAGNGTAVSGVSSSGSGPYALTGSLDVSNLSEGSYTLRVRVRDQAGNWSTATNVALTVTGPVFYSTRGNSTPPGAGGTADDADIYGWNGAAHARVFDASAAGLPNGANVDGYDRVDNTHFYLSFDGNVVVPGIGTVQDEDVVYNNAGTWSVWFDGTARGLTANNQDLDALSVVGGDLYFSTVGNTNPPGVTGAADNSDVYLWNGTAFSRVVDATAIGLPAATNVDGLVWQDATHQYLSFEPDTTAVPGLGNVQDEDVVHRGGTTWAVYFNGTGHGLTTANLDVDAFDLP